MILRIIKTESSKAVKCTEFRFHVVIAIIWCAWGATGDCPHVCECKWKSGKESVTCFNANLSVIPPHLDTGTQVLDLTGNNLVTIGRDAFHTARLTNLQKIYVAKCSIKTLDRYAFRKLTNLVELDLSYNVITVIPSHILDSISELRELKLSGNPIHRIFNDAFNNVQQLVRLELSNCRLGAIEQRAFSGLEHTLEWLKLDNNKLVNIKSSTLTTLHSLHGLELSGNPWNCSCTLRPLREWMLRQNLPSSISPACKFPSRLTNKPWDKLLLDDFACSPSVESTTNIIKTVESVNITLSCKITGSPYPEVKWLWKGRLIANISTGVTNSARKLYVIRTVNGTSRLTILSPELVDSGPYLCVAENNAGRVEANMSLVVTRRTLETGISWTVLLSSVFVALLFVITSCLFVLCLVSARHKRNTVNNATRHDSYEKIELNHKPPTVVMNHSGVPKANSNRYTEVAVVGPVKQHPRHREYRGLPVEDGDGDDEDDTPSTIASEARDVIEARSTTGDMSASRDYYSELPVQHHVLRKEVLATGSLYTTVSQEESRNYPDLLETSPQPRTSHFFGTIPRSRGRYPAVSESQSPLLADSRYGSSGGDSGGSRQLSTESRSSSFYRLPINDMVKRSSSSLNLASPTVSSITGLSIGSRRTSRRHPSLPTSPVRENRHSIRSVGPVTETPILDILEPRPMDYSPGALASTTYDYHAAQLERFLDEYRSLQEQLSKMKKTCENIRQAEIPAGTPDTVVRLLEPILKPGEETAPKSILKHKTSPDDSDTYWLQRNSSYEFGSGRLSDYYQS